jgi:hypothetical protein
VAGSTYNDATVRRLVCQWIASPPQSHRAIGFQTVRDWVLVFNANGPTGLIDMLGAAGRARGGGEAAVAHHLREILQIVQILQ